VIRKKQATTARHRVRLALPLYALAIASLVPLDLLGRSFSVLVG